MIKRITIKDFKSLRDVSVELGPVTVLIGCSGTGKSNFVNAIRFLRNYLYFGDQAVKDQKGWQEIMPATNPEPAMSFEVVFDITNLEGEFVYKLGFEHVQHNKQKFSEESLALGDHVFFHQKAGLWVKEPETVSVPHLNEPLIGKIPSISEVVIAFTALTSP